MERVDKGAALLKQAESNLGLALANVDPHMAGEKPQVLTAIGNVYKLLFELHGGKDAELTADQIAELMEAKGLELTATQTVDVG